jgi:hypothetical protein
MDASAWLKQIRASKAEIGVGHTFDVKYLELWFQELWFAFLSESGMTLQGFLKLQRQSSARKKAGLDKDSWAKDSNS